VINEKSHTISILAEDVQTMRNDFKCFIEMTKDQENRILNIEKYKEEREKKRNKRREKKNRKKLKRKLSFTQKTLKEFENRQKKKKKKK